MSTRPPSAPPEPSADEAMESLASGEQDERPGRDPASQPHDAMFRQVFGDPAHAAAALRAILPVRVAAHIDWDTPFEPMHASVVSDGAEQRHADLCFKARLIDGRDGFVWVMFEHQSTVQRWMPLRLGGMILRFLDNWHERHPGSRYLPAVLPVVLHHGPRPWRAPTSLLELTDLSAQAREDLGAHLLSLEFVLDDLRAVPDEAIDARPLGPLLRLMLGIMKHYRSPELLRYYEEHAADVRALLATEQGSYFLFVAIRYTERVNPHLDRATLIRHLNPLVGPGLEHTMQTFEQLLRQEAYQASFELGVERGQRDLLLGQLTERFGSLPAAVTERVARGSRAELERWGKRLLSAASLDDVFASA